MSSRQYLKRVWRVPKTGPAEYLAALVVKALVKHGWPARATLNPSGAGFQVFHYQQGYDLPEDFRAAVTIAVRIAARTHRLDVYEVDGSVIFQRSYTVTSAGHFREAK